jgi:hypothetical protein
VCSDVSSDDEEEKRERRIWQGSQNTGHPALGPLEKVEMRTLWRAALSLIQIQGLCTHPCSAVLTEHLLGVAFSRGKGRCDRNSRAYDILALILLHYIHHLQRRTTFQLRQSVQHHRAQVSIVYLTLLFILLAHWHSNVHITSLDSESKIRFSGTRSIGFYVVLSRPPLSSIVAPP